MARRLTITIAGAQGAGKTSIVDILIEALANGSNLRGYRLRVEDAEMQTGPEDAEIFIRTVQG